MDRKLSISKLLMLVLLLASYSSIYLINFACDVEQELGTLFTEATRIADHSHDHGAHSHEDHDHGTKNTEGSDSEEDGCCNDSAPVFIATLSNTIIPAFGININLPSTTLLTPLALSPIHSVQVRKEADYLNKAPPLIVPDLRILLHSFII